jgi:ribokinase
MTAPARTAVFVGDVSLDEYHELPSWPGLGEKAAVTPLAAHVGGTIANAACCMAALGSAVELVWALNDSPVGDRLRAHLASAGVGTRWVTTDASLPDSRTLVFLVDAEHTIFLPDPGAFRIPVTDGLLALMRSAEVVYTNGIEMRRLHRPGSDAGGPEILAGLRETGTIVALDLDVDAEDDVHLAAADIVFTNRVGFARLSGGSPPRAVAERLFGLGVRLLVVTRAAEGCTIHAPEGDLDLPGLPVEAIDVTGAGDSFGAAFVHAFAVTGDAALAGRFATAAGARATTLLGPQSGVATVAEVLEFMRVHGISEPGDHMRLTDPASGIRTPNPQLSPREEP